MMITDMGLMSAGSLQGTELHQVENIKGLPPGCSIAALKVLDRFGNGSREDVMRAFRWIMEFGSIYHIRIVNISVGTTSRDHKEQTDLLEGVEKLWDLGFVVVAAAGNQGRGRHGNSTGKQPENHYRRLQ